MIEWKTFPNGKRQGTFDDALADPCILSQRPGDNKIALGLSETSKMILTQAQVAELLPILTRFVETGELGE